MRPLAGSLADGVLADAIFLTPTTNIRKVRDCQKGTETKDACQCLKLKLKCLQ